jgi:hypothetical protein
MHVQAESVGVIHRDRSKRSFLQSLWRAQAVRGRALSLPHSVSQSASVIIILIIFPPISAALQAK